MLTQLILIELRTGEASRRDVYLARFPGFETAVAAAFRIYENAATEETAAFPTDANLATDPGTDHSGPDPQSPTLRELVYSTDLKTLFSGSSDGSVRVWDVAVGQQRAAYGTAMSIVYGLAFTEDGGTLMGAADHRVVQRWSTETRFEAPQNHRDVPAAGRAPQ